MNFNKQYFFIKNIIRLLNKGYSLNNILDLLVNIYPKEIKLIKLKLDEGLTFAAVIKTLKFKNFVYEALLVGEKCNKINEVLELVEKQFSFFIKLKKLFNRFLLYPLILLFISFISFELIRINLYPLIKTLIQNYPLKQNKFLVFIAFNLMKIIIGILFASSILLYFNKRLGNLIPLIKTYRLLVLIMYLDVLLTCGNSLGDAVNILKLSFNEKVYQINLFKKILLNENHYSSILTPYNKDFYIYFKQGLINNDLINALRDYSFFKEQILLDKLNKFAQYTQFSLFLIIAVNIFLIYYIIMIPILQISESI